MGDEKNAIFVSESILFLHMNTDNKIGLMSVADLSGKSFIIPDYQRGYRWESQQVTDLLKDLKSFMEGSSSGYYCLQPLAVKKKVAPDIVSLRDYVEKALCEDDELVIERLTGVLSDAISWEVIDGQQRLTTIYILIRLLQKSDNEPYSLTYKTREKSPSFLKDIHCKTKQDAEDNIDFLHMYQAYHDADNWLKDKDPDDSKNLRGRLLDVIQNRVKFIWYESVGENAIKVFTRLNIGKISLTNAELIKATLLNKSNYPDETGLSFISLQMEMAKKWDEIEYALQNEEFWLFLKNDLSNERPTRIDFLFEFIHDQDIYGLKPILAKKYDEIVGHDKYSVFRYFSAAIEYYQLQLSTTERLKKIWECVVSLYNTFVEWYNDKEYYHYVGFIIWDAEENYKNVFNILKNLYSLWESIDKQQFKQELIKKIQNIIGINKSSLGHLDFDKDKITIKRLLLLHNICEVLDTQRVQKDKYELNVFYKFPFHLFKKETWNVEHIDSATTNELTKPKERKAWIRAALFAISQIQNVESLKQRLISLSQKDDETEFANVHKEVEGLFSHADRLKTPESGDADQDNERNHLWNLTLLDEGTNKAYKNSIFSVKRSFLIYKEKGLHCSLDDSGSVSIDGQRAIAFVPPCTKQVFLKYYNPSPNDLLAWSRADAQAYLNDISNKLYGFLID